MTQVHVLPVNDLREHVEEIDCWCRPRQDVDEPAVIVHNSMDRREEYEEGKRRLC